MNINQDDPILTAYALGELNDADRAAVEQYLTENPEAQAEIDAIRETASLLSAEFAAEPAASTLTEAQRAEVLHAAENKTDSVVPVDFKQARRASFKFWTRIAALFLLVGAGAVGYQAVMAKLEKETKFSVALLERAKPAMVVTKETMPVPETAPTPPLSEAEPVTVAAKAEEKPAAAPVAEGDVVAQSVPPAPVAESAPDGHDGLAAASAPVDDRKGADERQDANALGGAVSAPAAPVGNEAPKPEPKPEKKKADAGAAVRLSEATSVPAAPPAKTEAVVPTEVREQLQALGYTSKEKEQTGQENSITVSADGRAISNNDVEMYQSYAPVKKQTAQMNAPAAPASAGGPPAASTSSTPPLQEEWTRLNVKTLSQQPVIDGPASSAPAGLTIESSKRLPSVMYSQDARAVKPYSSRGIAPLPTPAPGSESYAPVQENAFKRAAEEPLSTFGVDVDTASYANMRRFLNEGSVPPPDAVRIEELVNYFKYDYPAPEGDSPFAVKVNVLSCPWAPSHLLARVGLRGKDMPVETRPPANLVFLVDTSGSMQDQDKLPLLVKGLKLLTESLTGRDRISIVTYAGGAGVRLAPTSGDQKAVIQSVLDSLAAGGSTNGEGGIRLAYDLARQTFIQGGANRVILATDGDFNVGVSDTDTLVSMIQDSARAGIFLTVLGFGQGNLQDDRMEALADKGNGQYAYIDSFNEARKVLLEQAAGSLFTIAKDVKIQVEFNPAQVGAYRLIGYENRTMAAADFNNDRKDAGEIGAGHTVTALYELVPPGAEPVPATVDALKYQAKPEAAKPAPDSDAPASKELMTVKLRYKHPQGDTSAKIELPVNAGQIIASPAPDDRFAAAVAAFGMLLRRSAYSGAATMDQVVQWAEQGKGADNDGRRAEFINLARTAAALLGAQPPVQPVLQ